MKHSTAPGKRLAVLAILLIVGAGAAFQPCGPCGGLLTVRGACVAMPCCRPPAPGDGPVVRAPSCCKGMAPGDDGQAPIAPPSPQFSGKTFPVLVAAVLPDTGVSAQIAATLPVEPDGSPPIPPLLRSSILRV